MEHSQLKNTNPEAATHEGTALERWQDLLWEIDFCAGYEFAAMAGLAAPLMGLVTNDLAVINFYGGTLCQRRKLLQLAISSWTDPATLDDKLTNLSWNNGGKKLGFSYALQSEKFSVEQIKNAVALGGTRMAIMCGEHALDEDAYLDESVGSVKVYVLNLAVEKLEIEVDLALKAGAVMGQLSTISRSYAGEFLLQGLRERWPRAENICSCLRIQAGYEYEDDLIRIVHGLRAESPDAFDHTPALNLSYIPRMLSAIKAIVVIAIEGDVLPNLQHYAVFSEVYWRWAKDKIKQ